MRRHLVNERIQILSRMALSVFPYIYIEQKVKNWSTFPCGLPVFMFISISEFQID